ncbi:hypothetical protein MMC22_007266 [Lobaria immixta]|nr:hypothetical protein [Lobaria immixta]
MLIAVDAQMIQDADRFKMDLVRGLERTLQGKVKPKPLAPVITQCSIRHLYTLPLVPQPQKDALIAIARSLERRRCSHHTLDKPLSTLECLASVIDPKNSMTNKNRYVVASQEEEVRRHCRSVKGVPLVYVKRSVMVMEPMAESSVGVREGIERGKFRSGLRGKGHVVGSKRKRENSIDAEPGHVQDALGVDDGKGIDGEQGRKKKKLRGPKGPNPLSIKKSKKAKENQNQDGEQHDIAAVNTTVAETGGSEEKSPNIIEEDTLDKTQDPPKKRRRKRKHKIASLADVGGKE